jgi:YD repeat-containing protein
MRSTWRTLLTCIACGLAGLANWSAVARAEEASLVAGSGSSVFSNPTVIVGSPEEAQERQYERESGLHSPEAVLAREASQTKFEGLNSEQAGKLAGESFPQIMDVPAGGPPQLPDGQRIIAYPTPHTAQLELPDHKSAVLESLSPIAIETSPKTRVPVDLSLGESAGQFHPARDLVNVTIPRRLADGISLSDQSVSLTPVDGQDQPLGGSEGSVVGATVLYANTLTDADTVVKPTTEGFEVFSTLFSERSPEHLYFKVGLPANATLYQDAPSEVRIIKEGQTVSTVSAPSARDAEGASVPVSVRISSADTIELTVSRKPGEFRYPIVVDPTVTDSAVSPYQNGAWVPASSNPSLFNDGEWGGAVELFPLGTYPGGEFVAWEYETQGKSKVYEFEAESAEVDLDSESETQLEAWAPGPPPVRQNWGLLSHNNNHPMEAKAICAIETTTCLPSQGAEKNMVRFVKYTLAAGGGYDAFDDELAKARVWISQEEPPTAGFNTTSETISVKEPNGTVVQRENVLTPGSKGWIGPYSNTAFEVADHDPGIGVSFAAVDGGGWSREAFLMTKEKDCRGVQCAQEYRGKFTYFTTTPGFTKPMPSGEYSIESFAEDAVGLYGYSYATVRVDVTPPHSIKLSGLPSNDQIGEGVYKIQAEATDGETGTPSSGIQSLKLGVDGAEAAEPQGSCSLGPCTAKAEWSINGGRLSAGPHILTIVATDNAGNIEHQDFEVFVHHAAPLAFGPGSLNPQSGNYSLAASDISMGSGLTLTRTYSSRNLTAGAEGPLGPQWTMNLGSSESLVELPDGSMTLVASNGGETVFARNSKGELESPKGDTNLTLSPVENSEKVVTAYTFKDLAAGTSTTFARPTGYLQSTPSYYGQVGWQGPGSGQLSSPTGVATDAKGDIWVADAKNNRVEEFNPQGEYQTQFGSEGSGTNQFNQPHGIAVDAKGNIWVADTANNRLIEFTSTGSYIRQAGTEGTGKLNAPQGVATDSSNNVWVADTGNNRIVEFNEKGEYVREAAKVVGAHELAEPIGVATDSANDVWATDAKNHRVVEFSSAGASLKEFGSTGIGNGQFETPTGIAIDSENDVWVADYGLNRLQEFNAKGEYLTKVGTGGVNGGQLNRPYFVALNKIGNLMVADRENSRVDRWAHATWVPSTSESAAPQTQVTYTFKTVLLNGGTVVQPTRVVAPHLASLSCAPTIKQGCRALVLKYDEGKTTATGESESEWGEYEGRLKEVLFDAYNPSTKTVQEIAVAQYAYDGKGKLRTEWDPRISPALKTLYGYDLEGHVTGLTPPGQQPWLLTYGTSTVDASTGRLLTVTRPAAATASGDGIAPVNTTAPLLSTKTPVVGTQLSVNTGVWSNSPLTYGYQWEDCLKIISVFGGKLTITHSCTPIPGANNATYTPLVKDSAYQLRAAVIATNATGSATSYSGYSEEPGSGTMTEEPAAPPPSVGTNAVSTVEYNVPLSGTGLQNLKASEIKAWAQEDAPTEGTAIYPPDEPMGWPAQDYKRATIYYLDGEGHTVNTVTPGGGVSTAEYGPTNNVVRTLSADNRAAALKEGTKSAEVAKLLDERSVYNEEGDELLETLGPQHKIKLSSDGEVEARHRVKYTYDQNSLGGKSYHLITETVSSALVSGKEEEQKRTQTRYSGQNGLGWTLRKPTATVTNPEGLNLVNSTVYNETTGAVEETRTPSGNAETVYPAVYSGEIGSEGVAKGQFEHPVAASLDSAGDIWVDDKNNGRLEKFSASGSFLAEYGSKGSGNDQFSNAWAMAIAQSTGNVYVADTGNNRVEELNSGGTFVRTFGTEGAGRLNEPDGVAVDPSGDVWVSDYVNNRLVEFSATGEFMREVGTAGTGNGQFKGPEGIAVSEGSLYVVDNGNDRIEQFSLSGAYLNQFGKKGSGPGELNEPIAIASNPTSGNLYVSDLGNHRIEEFSPAGRFLTDWETWSKPHTVAYPTGLAIASSGELYIADEYGDEVSEWVLPEAGGAKMNYTSQYGSTGSGEGQFRGPFSSSIDGHGDLWVTDHYNSRLEEFSASGKFMASYGSEGSGNGQFREPWGVDINQSTGNVYVSDSGNNRVEELSSSGAFIRTFGTTETGKLNKPAGIKLDSSGNVWVADEGDNRVVEFSSTGTFIAAYGSEGSGNGQFKGPIEIAFSGSNLYVTDLRNDRVQELSATGSYIRQFGIEGSNSGEFYGPIGIAADSAGNLYVTDNANDRVEEFSAAGAFRASFGSKGTGEGQFEYPQGISISAAGAMYVIDTDDNRVEQWMPANQAAHDQENVYYSSGANAKFPQCGGHVEWEGLECETLPVAQPETSGVPPLPTVIVAAYNMWGEPEKTEEIFGSVTRTRLTNYDGAGRILWTEETSSADAALPKVTDEYSEKTGQLITQTTKVGEETQTVTKVFDKVGRLTSYTDADKNTTTYEYESSGDGRLLSINDGKGTQTFAYDPTTGALYKLVDSSAGTFTASFDAEGHIASETYPNGMTATYHRSSVGQTTGIEYVKATHCAKTCPEIWFSENEVPSIEGEALTRTNTLTSNTYSYDAANRLIQTTEEPVGGKGCVTRMYGYDEESDRTSLTTREPVEGKCAVSGGTVEKHTYGSGNRLTDAGVTYDAFGDTTQLPGVDAGGHELTTEFYVDGQVRKQAQNGQTNTYSVDPAGRIRKTIAEGSTNLTTINHYSSEGEGISWKEEGAGKFTRLIPGIDGNLAAVEVNSETPTLQLHDIEGNVVATAALAETETKLLSMYNSTEFGVPINGAPPAKYSWSGAAGLTSELSSGTLVMGTVSYVPQLGRTLQTEAVTPPGEAVDGAEGIEYVDQASGWSIEAGNTMAQAKKQEYEIELQKAAEREAEEKLKHLAEGAEDPGELTFVFSPGIWVLEAERLEVIAGRTQLIGLALAILPVIGEVSGESTAAYAEYLRGWADTFKGNAKLMETELARDKKDKLPIVVYALFEEYGNIPLLGRFPVYFVTDQCEYLGHTNGNTVLFCPGGKYKGFWEIEGEYR